MRYVAARYEECIREHTYRIYVTDGLKAIANLNMRWADMVSFEKHEEQRSAEEIIDDIGNKLERIGKE